MKLFTVTIAAAMISGAAFAEQSDRYNDLRLDTSETSTTSYAEGKQNVADPSKSQRYNDQRLRTNDREFNSDVTFSSRNQTAGEGYIYGGFGPGNDSR